MYNVFPFLSNDFPELIFYGIETMRPKFSGSLKNLSLSINLHDANMFFSGIFL